MSLKERISVDNYFFLSIARALRTRLRTVCIAYNFIRLSALIEDHGGALNGASGTRVARDRC